MTSIAPHVRRFKSQILSASSAGDFIEDDAIERACRQVGHRWRRCYWTPAVTILTFVRQVLNGNCACRRAVAMTLASGLSEPVAANDGMACDPSAYSQARQKLPRALLEQLNRQVVERVRAFAGSSKRWCGRRVVIVDGSSASMPDTPQLQSTFPQPSGQKPGCGFPVARLLAIFCWASGCLEELLADSLHVSELSLFRRLLGRLPAGTVVLADTFFSSYYDLVLIQQDGLDGVYRLHQRRPTDLRFGMRLGIGDHLITWDKPKIPPRGVSPEDWAPIPQSLTVRHVRVNIDRAGFRRRSLDLVTTLLDAATYTTEDLAGLYRDRWMAELNLRSLKTIMGMEVLRCQSIDMVHKELLIYQLAYNLVRILMWRAAEEHSTDVRRLSHAGTMQRIAAVLPHLQHCRTTAAQAVMMRRLLNWIAADTLPDRPGRFEPRCVKRRPKQYTFLTKSRRSYRSRADDQWR
jgi:Transposase DDE domain